VRGSKGTEGTHHGSRKRSKRLNGCKREKYHIYCWGYTSGGIKIVCTCGNKLGSIYPLPDVVLMGDRWLGVKLRRLELFDVAGHDNEHCDGPQMRQGGDVA